MISKRSQITIFIVLGIIIFTIIGLLFYLKTYIKSKQFTEEQQEVTDVFTTQGKYSSYMQSCLDQTAKQSIALVGMQGGVIYDYQVNGTKQFLGPKKYEYGQYVLPFQYTKEANAFDSTKTIFNVSYGIYAPDLSLGIEGHPTVPEYPYGLTKLIEDPTEIDEMYSNSLGNILMTPLPPLCDYYGANTPTQAGAVFSCETYDSKRKADNDNIQEYVEKFIQYTFKQCVALESFQEFANSSIKSGNISVRVTFAPANVAVEATYPIVGQIKGKEAIISLEQFHTTVNVRLKQIHEFAERLIEADTNNIFFNIVHNANELVDCKESGKEAEVTTCLKEGMQITKYRDVCQSLDLCKHYGQYDDILLIQDNLSTINGKPFIFAFAIQNRYPALEYEDDKIVTQGETIEINPKAYDPDEDDHNAFDFMDHRYIYGMWKVDYDEVGGVKTNVGSVIDGFVINDEKDAFYQTKNADVGSHVVQVQACDNEGLCDFQNINIEVLSGST